MKKIISLILACVLIISISSCSKKEQKLDVVPENALGSDFYVRLDTGETKYLVLGDVINFVGGSTGFYNFDTKENKTIDKTLSGPYGVQVGEAANEFLNYYEIKDNYAVLYNNDEYLNYDGTLPKVEGDALGHIYQAYLINKKGEWTALNFTQVKSVLTMTALMESTTPIILIGMTYNSDNTIENIGIITGNFSDVTLYIKK